MIQNPEQNKGKSHYEWDMNRQGLSWKTKLRHMIDDCIMKSADFEDFLKKCAESGIEAVYAPEKKISLKFRMEGQQRFTRAKTLGWYYEPKQISDRIKMFHQITINHTKIIDIVILLERQNNLKDLKSSRNSIIQRIVIMNMHSEPVLQGMPEIFNWIQFG